LTDEYDGAAVDVLVRPDDLRATPVETGGATDSPGASEVSGASAAGDGTVVGREYTGPSFVYEVELDSGDLVRCEHNHASEFDLDRRVRVDLTADHTLAWYPTE